MFASKDKWATFSLQKQLLIVFCTCVAITLIVAELITVISLVGVSKSISTGSTATLTSQLSDGLANSVVRNTASLFESLMTKTINSGLLIIARSTGDTFRPSYSSQPIPSFFDLPNTIDTPTNMPYTDPRYPGATISLTHSSWMVPSGTRSILKAAPATNSTSLNPTSNVDSFFRTIYAQNQAIASAYVGFKDDGFFRHYPGTGTIQNSGPYDPRQRPWYQAALTYTIPTSQPPYKPSSSVFVVVTDPYLDAAGKGWCITAATVITGTPEDNTEANVNGVAGVDVVLTSLSSQLSQFTASIPGSSVGIYVLASGSMIANSKWTPAFVNTTGTTSPTYATFENPSISKDFWQNNVANADASINTNSDNYASKTYTDPSTGTTYLLIWKTLTLTNGQFYSSASSTTTTPTWVVLASIPYSTIQDPVNQVVSETTKSMTTSILISLGIFAIVFVLVVGMVIWVSNSAVKPLSKLSTESSMISNNIGNTDLFEGVSRRDSMLRFKTGLRHRIGRVDEAEELTNRFYSMVQTIGSTLTGQESNVFFRNTQLPNWDPSAQDPMAVTLLPDAPPSYDVSKGTSAAAGPSNVVGSAAAAAATSSVPVAGSSPSFLKS